MRVKSHWFKPGAPKSAAEIAGACAFIVFRVAQNALKGMRTARFELPPGPRYFAFLSEFLVFLTLAADRLAYRRGDEAWRLEFTTALANRVGEILGDNEADLIGGETVTAAKRRFVALVNERSADYAECGWSAEGPDYTFLRCLGHHAAAVMDERERTWAVPQVIDCEAPEAVATLTRAMAGLTDSSPRPARARSAMQGE